MVSTWVARANRSLLAFLTHKAQYDEMRAGIMQRFEELASVQD